MDERRMGGQASEEGKGIRNEQHLRQRTYWARYEREREREREREMMAAKPRFHTALLAGTQQAGAAVDYS